MLSVITALEFFQHYFSEMGHRDLLVTQNLSQAHRATNAPLPHAKRPPPGGYVLTHKSSMWISDKALTLIRVRSRNALDLQPDGVQISFAVLDCRMINRNF